MFTMLTTWRVHLLYVATLYRLKSDFEGHDNIHHNNLYAYVAGNCFGVGSFKPDHQDG